MNREALARYFDDWANRRQCLGTIDCVQFVAGAVYVGWNRDYRNVLQYDDRRSAVRRLRELGGLQAACCHAMGDMRPIDELEPGDVVWFDRPATIGLLMPNYVAVKMGRTIHRLVIEPHMRGWRSGR